MARDPADLDEWTHLRAQWQEANQNARLRRSGVTYADAQQVDGNSAGPTQQQINEAIEMEQRADGLSIDLDNLARRLLM